MGIVSSPPPPSKIVSYPIDGDANGGALFLYGDATKATRLALMSPGFPDDQEVLLPFADRLAKETNTLAGVICFPGFDDRPDRSWTVNNKDGYDYDQVTDAFRDAAKALRAESTAARVSSNNSNIKPAVMVGIFHDYGVVPGMLWFNRAVAEAKEEGSEKELAPEKVVLFDVLPPPSKTHDYDKKSALPSLSMARELFITIFYRGVFALSFLAQRYVANILGCIVFVFGTSVMSLFRISPTLKIDADILAQRKPPMALSRILYMCYPYVSFFGAAMGRINMEAYTLPVNLNKTPCLYLYGTEKRINFHDYNALSILEKEERNQNSQSRAIAVEKAGHWLYVQQFDLCFRHVKNFLEGDVDTKEE